MKLLAFGILINVCIFITSCMTAGAEKRWDDAVDAFGRHHDKGPNKEPANQNAPAPTVSK